MADPLSSAASVAGLVSLGLQACSGVSMYLDAVQGRNDDLESARQSAKNLEDTVRFIEQFMPQLQANHQTQVVTISKCVQSCQIQLTALQNIIHNLESSPSLGGSLWANARERKKQLTYPFHRPSLDRLESRLGKVNGTLQTALHVLEIHGRQATNTMLVGIEAVTRDTPTELRRINSEISVASSTLQVVDNALPCIQDAVTALGPLLTSKAEETSKQLARMESSIVSSMFAHQTLLANAVKTAHKRNTAHEKDLNSLRELLLRRLVSAPSALKELSDELAPSRFSIPGGNASITQNQLQVSASSLVTSHSGCQCRVRKTYQGRQSQLGSLCFYNQALVEERHLPGCPCGTFTKTRSKQAYGITYTGLVRVVNKAIDLSFSMCFGAGGWSISPKFRCISTVDVRTAPVFRLMGDLSAATRYSMNPLTHGNSGNLSMTIPEWKGFVDSVVGKIGWLFDNRLGCPDDVNERNQTIMFSVLGVVYRASSIHGCHEDRENIIGNLMSLLEVTRHYDVPVFPYDNNGCTAFLHISDAFMKHPSWTAPIMDTIVPSASEIFPSVSRSLKMEGGWKSEPTLHEMVSAFEISQTYAECWACGPLSLAIVSGDLENVRHILQKHPTLLKEVNLIEQTPFHLAAGNPTCLSLLLAALQPADYDLLDQVDLRGDNALVYAIAFSLKHCRSNSPRQKCRRCTCASSLVMLLKTGACSLSLSTILKDIFNTQASLRCKIKFINHMKHRGNRLKRLAMDSPFWTSTDTDRFNLHSTDALDVYAEQVVLILEKNGVRIPNSFKSTHQGDSVYHLIIDAADAEEFYRRGFRNVAVPNNKGLLPLDRAHLLPSYLNWLVEHGAPLTPVLPRSKRSTSEEFGCQDSRGKKTAVSQERTRAHVVAFRTGHFVSRCPAELRASVFRTEEYSIKLLSASIVQADIVDDCNCPCTDGGCIPWTDMLKGLCGTTEYPGREVNSVHDLSARFSAFLRTTHEVLGPSQLKAAIRFLTFCGLGMTHVCCWPCCYGTILGPHSHRMYKCEEAREIQLLEHRELLILENLVAEFSERLNLHSSPMLVDLVTLDDFWKQHWVSRMEEALEESRGPPDYETDIKGAESIGVVWKPSKKDELSGYAYWISRIDKIMEDARGLLQANNG